LDVDFTAVSVTTRVIVNGLSKTSGFQIWDTECQWVYSDFKNPGQLLGMGENVENLLSKPNYSYPKKVCEILLFKKTGVWITKLSPSFLENSHLFSFH
jgi:hypothetical protein